MHPTAKARLGDDHHNGAGGEAKSEPLGPTCSGGLTPPSQADHRPDRVGSRRPVRGATVTRDSGRCTVTTSSRLPECVGGHPQPPV